MKISEKQAGGVAHHFALKVGGNRCDAAIGADLKQASESASRQASLIPLSWKGAFILSITAFHGRGFFLGGEFGYESTVTLLAAIEAIVGLFIELSFIATFTQRFLGK